MLINNCTHLFAVIVVAWYVSAVPKTIICWVLNLGRLILMRCSWIRRAFNKSARNALYWSQEFMWWDDNPCAVLLFKFKAAVRVVRSVEGSFAACIHWLRSWKRGVSWSGTISNFPWRCSHGKMVERGASVVLLSCWCCFCDGGIWIWRFLSIQLALRASAFPAYNFRKWFQYHQSNPYQV